MANLDLETLVNDINEKAMLEEANSLSYAEIIDKLILESNYSDDVKSDLLFFATENYKASPLKSLLKELEEIKNAKPDEYSDEEEVKKFVDKNYDKIKKAAELLEKEPSELSKSNIENLLSIFGVLTIGYVSTFAGLPIAGAVLFLLSPILIIATTIVSHARTSDDMSSYKNLKRIKDGLKKINVDKLPDSYKKKVRSLLTKIDDMEESFNTRKKFSTESAINTELQEKKLAIYEKCANGEITLEEREQMINDLREDIIMDHIAESTNNDDLKYNKARLMIYEKCSNGEITEDTREVLLAKLKEKMNK